MKRKNNTELGNAEERTRKRAEGGKVEKEARRAGEKGRLGMGQPKALTEPPTCICSFEKADITNVIFENTSFRM